MQVFGAIFRIPYLIGLVAVITWAVRLMILGFGYVFQAILNAVGSASGVDSDVTIENILFTGVSSSVIANAEILDVNFFDLDSSDNVANTFRKQIAKWYYVIRLIATAILLVILIYVGIRMALSTVASEQAKYKQMLTDWVTSIALLFLLHYIIIFIITINSTLVNALSDGIVVNSDGDTVGEQMDDILTSEDSMFESGFDGLLYASMFCFLKGQSLMFLVFYMKRMITVGFLIMIAPLITITYSLDKMGDGKAQALNTWLKEFSYNILIQPFHCIIYLSFFGAVSSILSDSEDGIRGCILGMVVLLFMKQAEGILRKIFHFEAQSMSGLDETTQNIMNAKDKFAHLGMMAGRGAVKFAKGVKTIGSDTAGLIKNAKANSKLKQEYKSNNELNSSQSWKEYKNSEAGQKRREEIKTNAHQMSKRVNDRRISKERKLNEKADKEVRKSMGEAAYNKLVQDTNSSDPKVAEQARKTLAEKTNDAKQKIKNSNGQKIIRGVSKGWNAAGKGLNKGLNVAGKGLNAAGNGIRRFSNSRTGQVMKEYLKDSAKVASAIAAGSFGLGMTGKLNDAISTGQLGYGITSGILTQSNGGVAKDTAEYMKKYNNLTGTTAKDTSDTMNLIYKNGEAGEYKDLDAKMNKFVDQISKLLNGNTEKAADLAREIKLAVSDPRRSIDLNSLINNLDIDDEEDEKKVFDNSAAFTKTLLEALMYSEIKKGEGIGTDVDTISYHVERKISKYEKHIDTYENTTEKIHTKRETEYTYEDSQRNNQNNNRS